jgi:ATP-dependent RNA helicase RhlE
VVNYELPNVPEDYVHRIGRTGRAGSSGQAVSLVCVDEHKLLRDIERLLKRDIEKKVVAGFEPDPRIKPEPIQKPRGAGGGRDGKAPHGARQNQPSRHASSGKPAGGARQGQRAGQGSSRRGAGDTRRARDC